MGVFFSLFIVFKFFISVCVGALILILAIVVFHVVGAQLGLVF